MDFLEKLEILMSNHNIKNKKQLALESGIPYTTIINWYNRSYENMTISNFKILCDFFRVTMDSMARNDLEIEYYNPNSKNFYISKEEKYLLQCYRASDDMHKGLAQCAVGADKKVKLEKNVQNVV